MADANELEQEADDAEAHASADTEQADDLRKAAEETRDAEASADDARSRNE